ncbi:hypothetical protein [Nocardioides sp. WS12]|uniref:hypothetical protein n=1 Tax=Nocardioides sp. WS12 TaxID=2486272 RepID=UPI0015FC3C47|nr:hypothetical protein [Nocardioides sp. WS12]
MSSPEPDARSVSPLVAGLVPVLTLAVFVGLAYFAGKAIDGPSWLTNVLVIIGACVGYVVSRTILRWIFTPR